MVLAAEIGILWPFTVALECVFELSAAACHARSTYIACGEKIACECVFELYL